MKRIFSLITVMLVLAFGTITTFMATPLGTTSTPQFEASIEWDGEVWTLSLYVNGERFTVEVDYIFAVAELSEELETIVQLLGVHPPLQFMVYCEDDDCTTMPLAYTPTPTLTPSTTPTPNPITIPAPATPTPSPIATPAPAQAAGSTTVFLSATGTRWHSINNCGNMNPDNTRSVTLEYARGRIDLSACTRCNAPR